LTGNDESVTAVLAEELLRLPVRVRGIDLGKVVDLLVDPLARRVLGLDVLCRDESRRFLPLSAAEIADGTITAGSALTLLAEDQLDFYRKRATTLRALRGAPVQLHGTKVGLLTDIVLTHDGAITELVVANGRTRARYPVEVALRLSATAA
jgi:sporulation protein YlmC with PRC-barrel domain